MTACFAFSSGELPKAGVSQSLGEISDRNDDSILLKNFSEEANGLQNHAQMGPSGDKLNVKKCESPSDPCIPRSCYSPGSTHLGDGLVLDEWISVSGDEHITKRMRTTPTDGEGELANNLSKDELHL